MDEQSSVSHSSIVPAIDSVPQAVAVLGFGLMLADGGVALDELSELVGALRRHYFLDEGRIGDLLLFARYLHQHGDATSSAIRFLASALDIAGKENLARFLGELAQADGELRPAETDYARRVFRGLSTQH